MLASNRDAATCLSMPSTGDSPRGTPGLSTPAQLSCGVCRVRAFAIAQHGVNSSCHKAALAISHQPYLARMEIDDVPLIVSWFENPTVIARAMGLDIELPDPDNQDPAHVKWAMGLEWRSALSGKVDMSPEEMARHDPDWVRLKRLEGTTEAWFDLETGIVFRCRAADIGHTATVIRELASRCGLRLATQRWPYSVVAIAAMGGAGLELAPRMEPAGFRWDEPWWILQQSAARVRRCRPGSRSVDAAALPGRVGSASADDIHAALFGGCAAAPGKHPAARAGALMTSHGQHRALPGHALPLGEIEVSSRPSSSQPRGGSP